MLRIIVMGVSGSGKSTVGEKIADELALPFLEGDSLHPKSNVDKMSAGIPLQDEDRWPRSTKSVNVLRLRPTESLFPVPH